MAHFLSEDNTASTTLLETEQLDDMNDYWTPNGFGIMHIFTEPTRIKKRLRDLDFELPYIQKHFEDIDMDSVVTIVIGVDKKHRKNVLRLNPEVGENGRIGKVLFKNEFGLQNYASAMDSTGRNLYLTGGCGLRDTGSNQAVKLRFSMDPLDRVLKCESKTLSNLRNKRFHHSSMIVRDHLFVFFGDTYNKMSMRC